MKAWLTFLMYLMKEIEYSIDEGREETGFIGLGLLKTMLTFKEMWLLKINGYKL